jgi:glutamate synthase (ferredoxin)
MVVRYRVGRNVAAGMTGGLAYFLDEDDTFTPKVLPLQLFLVHAMR